MSEPHLSTKNLFWAGLFPGVPESAPSLWPSPSPSARHGGITGLRTMFVSIEAAGCLQNGAFHRALMHSRSFRLQFRHSVSHVVPHRQLSQCSACHPQTQPPALPAAPQSYQQVRPSHQHLQLQRSAHLSQASSQVSARGLSGTHQGMHRRTKSYPPYLWLLRSSRTLPASAAALTLHMAHAGVNEHRWPPWHRHPD